MSRARLVVVGVAGLVAAACRRAPPAKNASAIDAAIAPAAPTAAGPKSTCAADGCLRSAQKIGDFSADALRGVIDPRLSIDNGYSVWSIEYATGDRTSLATVTIPFEIDPPARGWDVVANDHGTVGLDDPCKLTGTVYGAGLAGLFGARKAIGVATDYPGLGTAGVLPYLVSESEAKATLDALRAARQLATWQGARVSGRFAIAGLSEGGHAALAAAALHRRYAPELDVRAIAVAAPASVYEEDWRAGFVDGAPAVFEAMLVFAWHEQYGGPSPWASAMEATVRTAMTTQCVGAFGSTGGIGATLGTTQRAKIFSPTFIAAFESGTWGAYAAFGKAFADNRIVPYAQSASLKIYQGDADTVVFEKRTSALVDTLRAGGVVVDYEVVPGATHFDLAFGFLASFELRTQASIDWIRAKLDAP
jgi:dienelactone hydrolase